MKVSKILLGSRGYFQRTGMILFFFYFTKEVKRWSKEVFGHLGHQKQKLQRELSRLESRHKLAPMSAQDVLRRNQIRHQLEGILIQEELMWLQKSRCNWYSFGDRNTRYFHAIANNRRKRNRVEALKLQDDEWLYDVQAIKEAGSTYFEKLYQEEDGALDTVIFDKSYPPLDDDILFSLTEHIQPAEIKRALFDMGPLKAPGPDGLNPLFFQSQWEVVGPSIVSTVHRIVDEPAEVRSINQTSIVVIPKIDVPENFRDFRPISLCNVIYKVITKTITNRLKRIMPIIISPHQSSFVPGRQGADNVVVAQEIIHSMSKN